MSSSWRALLGWGTVVMAVCAGFLFVSCSSLTRDVPLARIEPATIPGAEYIGIEQCVVCHAKQAKGFQDEPHAAFTVASAEGANAAGEGCESCHGPGSLHASDPQDETKILLGSSERCMECHLDKRAKLHLRYSHPVRDGRISCMDCHDPHENKQPVHSPQEINRTCFECHPDIEGPWTFPHQAVEQDGCTVCHDPHGSNLDKLLVADSANLCLRCHFQGDHPGDIGSQSHTAHFDAIARGCLNCHRGVHGSNFNQHLRHP